MKKEEYTKIEIREEETRCTLQKRHDNDRRNLRRLKRKS